MDKRNLKWITWGFALVTVLIVALMLANTLRRSVHITLPPPQSSTEESQGNAEANRDALSVIEITPETVQAAIETLRRPASYRRTITVEQFWNGGSGEWSVTAYVRGGWSRSDRMMPDYRTRHTVTNGETTYIWYNSENEVYAAAAGEITADNDQAIPTYEDILSLAAEEIALADYRDLSGVNCIYTETAENDRGYSLHYWVSVDTGLLVSAEKLQEGEVIYRMTALTLDAVEPTNADFTLPDGTNLLKS